MIEVVERDELCLAFPKRVRMAQDSKCQREREDPEPDDGGTCAARARSHERLRTREDSSSTLSTGSERSGRRCWRDNVARRITRFRPRRALRRLPAAPPSAPAGPGAEGLRSAAWRAPPGMAVPCAPDREEDAVAPSREAPRGSGDPGSGGRTKRSRRSHFAISAPRRIPGRSASVSRRSGRPACLPSRSRRRAERPAARAPS